MPDWRLLTAVAQQQHQVLARWQLCLAGASSKAVKARCADHGWRSGEFGTVWLPGPLDPIRRLTSAVLAYSRPRSGPERVRAREAAGDDAETALVRAALDAGQTVCGPSAAWLHGLSEPPQEQWLRLPGRTGHTRQQGVRLRYGPPTSVVWKEGLPVADVHQMIADVAVAIGHSRGARYELGKLVALGHAKRLTTPQQFGDWLAEVGAVDGALLCNEVVADLLGETVHSETERRARELARQVLEPYGLQLHPHPFRVDLDGRPAGEADLAVVELRYDIEVDGPHHLLPQQIAKDRARDRLMREAGWVVERFAAEEIDLRPHEFKRAIDRTIRQLLQTTHPNPQRTVLSEGV